MRYRANYTYKSRPSELGGHWQYHNFSPYSPAAPRCCASLRGGARLATLALSRFVEILLNRFSLVFPAENQKVLRASSEHVVRGLVALLIYTEALRGTERREERCEPSVRSLLIVVAGEIVKSLNRKIYGDLTA